MRTLRNAAILFVSLSLYLVGMLVVTAQPASASTIGPAPIPWATANGPVLTSTIMRIPQEVLLVGGNFTQITQKNGTVVAAQNFAAIDVASGAVIFHANTGSTGYVRTVYATWGNIYIGGNFTAVNGVSRGHIAQLDAYTGALKNWKPADIGVVNAVTAGQQAVYYGSSNKVNAASPANAAAIWSQPVSGGPVKSLRLLSDEQRLFVGGLFEKVGTLTQHGLMMIYPAISGAVNPGFVTHLATDSGVGVSGSYDGEEALSLVEDAWGNIYAGIGGIQNGIYQLDGWSGATKWYQPYEADVQGIGYFGTNIIAGYHRNHGNIYHGIPYPIFTAVSSVFDGTLTGPDLKLTGDFPGNAAGGNGGGQSVSTTGSLVFVTGEFTTWGATCTYAGTGNPGYTCTGGSSRNAIAVFPAS